MSFLQRWLAKFWTTETTVHGLDVVVITRPHHGVKPEAVIERLGLALDMIRDYQPRRYRRLISDLQVTGIFVRRHYCRGAYFYESGWVLIELTFVGWGEHSEAEVAAELIRLSVHARLHEMGVQPTEEKRVRREQIARKAELLFAEAAPVPAKVLRRVKDILQGLEADALSFAIDEEEAWRQVAKRDLQTAELPDWFRNVLAKRRGLSDG